jgi:hypothetical protein
MAGMQLVPWCGLGLSRESQPGIVTSLDRVSGFRFERYLMRYEYDLLVEIREMSDHLLVMELYIDTRIPE